ncbi:hypothetical protein EG329_001353 [Mollisiaceae sp. DMI_Dod_QoI]|nr:hypothetical protein EG329_001353 [Helotiales sp. DMI_Dod_QoI]
MSLPVGDPAFQDSTKPEVVESGTSANHSTKARDDFKWDSYKDEIRRMYVDEGRPLRFTKQNIERRFGYQKSVRNWKSKLRDWGFDKNVTINMKFMLAKSEKRARDEGKDTEFKRNGILVPPQTLQQFKKRRTVGLTDSALSSIATPPNITYGTPNIDASPRSTTSLTKSISPGYPTEQSLVDLTEDFSDLFQKEAPTLGQTIEASSSEDIKPNTDDIVISLSVPQDTSTKPAKAAPLSAQDKPTRIGRGTAPDDFGYNAAASSMKSLFHSFRCSSAYLSDETYERYVDNILKLLQILPPHDQELNNLFRENFTLLLADEAFQYTTSSDSSTEKVLFAILEGLASLRKGPF